MQEWFVQFIWQAWLLTCFPPGLPCLFARTIFWGAEHQVLAPAAGGVRSIWCGLEDGISWDSFKSNLMVINYPAGWPSRKAVASLSNMYHKKYISIQPLGWLVPFLEVSIQDLVSTFRVTMHLTCSNRMLLSCMFFFGCRTKRFLSSPDYQPDKFLYLPASVAQEVASASPPPGTGNWVAGEHVILAISNPWQSTSMTQWTPRAMRTRHCEGMPTSCVKAWVSTLEKTYQMSVGFLVEIFDNRPEANHLFAWTARLHALRIWPTMCMVDFPF